MLLNFRFSNYRSFRDETEFSMAAAPISEHKSSLFEVNGVNILPLAGIYGANASGKSSFFKAIECMKNVVLGKNIPADSNLPEPISFTMPYLFSGTEEEVFSEPSCFEVTISIMDYAYTYGYECVDDELISEWLYKQKISKNPTVQTVIYNIDYQDNLIEYGKIPAVQKKEIDFCFSMNTGKNLLLTDLGKRGRDREIDRVFDWFGCSMVATAESPDSWQYACEQILCSIMEKEIGNEWFKLREKTPKDEILRLIREFAPAISDIVVERLPVTSERTEYKLKTVHEVDGREYTVPFEIESDGTRRNFALTFYLIGTLASGCALFVDELDYRLHPLVLRKILNMFYDKEINKMGAQLIFSAHNIINLDSSDLRRDEVWFVEKNDQCSSMYSLYDFNDEDDRVRNDLDFGKHYLSGRFGAIPFREEV